MAAEIERLEEHTPASCLVVADLTYQAALRGEEFGRLSQAEDLFRRSIRIRREHCSPGHPDVAESLLGLGRHLHNRGRYEESVPILRECWSILAVIAPDDPLTAEAQLLLGSGLCGLSQFAEAERLLESACEALHQAPVPLQKKRHVLEELVFLHQATGNADQEQDYREKLALLD
jgi:tetratricopeptide (TPR) repeat protein